MRSRILEVMEREGMSQGQFADYIGINRPTLSHVVAGRNNPSLDVVMKIHQKFPSINLSWLLDGVGSYDGNDGNDGNEGAESSICASSSYDDGGSLPIGTNSNYMQGELFAENPIFQPESTFGLKERKEMSLQGDQNPHYTAENQNVVPQNFLHRKIVEIKIFYNDGTYETFKP